MARFPLSDWSAEQFRLSVFPTPGYTRQSQSIEWWQGAVGSPPDETTVNSKTGIMLAAGPFGDGKLLLRFELDRIDWLLVPLDHDPAAPMAIAQVLTLGRATEVLPGFSEIVEKWLAQSDVPGVARLAFGAVFTHNEADRRSGYLQLPDYVPVEVDPESSAFLYQINLPIPSRTGIDRLRINRLSKWSVAAYKLIAFNVAVAESAPPFSATPVFALRLELDIN